MVLVELHGGLRRGKIFARAWGIRLLKKGDAEGVGIDASRRSICDMEVPQWSLARGAIICLLPGCHRKPTGWSLEHLKDFTVTVAKDWMNINGRVDETRQ